MMDVAVVQVQRRSSRPVGHLSQISTSLPVFTATAWLIAVVAMANTGITGRIMQLGTVLVLEACCTPFASRLGCTILG